MKVAVIGAGVAGLTSALALSERDPAAEIEIFERGEAVGSEACSRFAGGMLAPWCEGESAEPLVVSLGREALDWWPRLSSSAVTAGTLVVAQRRDQAELSRFSRRTEAHEAVGADARGRARAGASAAASRAACSFPARPISTRAGRSPSSPTGFASAASRSASAAKRGLRISTPTSCSTAAASPPATSFPTCAA